MGKERPKSEEIDGEEMGGSKREKSKEKEGGTNIYIFLSTHFFTFYYLFHKTNLIRIYNLSLIFMKTNV